MVPDASKRSRSLGTVYKRGIPIEVVPAAAPYVLAGLEVLGAVEPALRMGGEVKAGPCVTENGNFLIDAPFPDGVMGGGMVEGGLAGQVVALAAALKQMVGVVEHGLFTAADRAPDRVYFGVWGEGECKVEVLDDA